ncbi:glucosamine-6-phosphate deaminase [Coraliomargarita sp. SDUM461003]|uniref:Glucosamine-6-phosphate deaminase n=1 Tax=Thalassobacterium maritimum TaxID=3041265 RepID=A0ABU1AX95_9BACT|nr:glucosamine-6-phosphate deaminase [Coraliomargarita sp. SDUM461003]MDQ8208728.1 glucosamine-6-phosphate deaminase [Coraliomargarita sp. SDUM461003]
MTQLVSELTQLERIPTQIYENADAACQTVANAITDLINERNAAGKPTVLGLATGSTPVRLYRELIRRHQQEGLSFANVITFNLDEYYGLAGDHPESYRKFMQDQLFDHVDLKPENTHVPDGLVDRDAVFQSCKEYEAAIADAGGIDIQILGIGRTGHIGFNEPGSGPETLTRLVTLDNLTRRDAARDFLGEENVPRHAITMGVGTILAAHQLFLLAWGEGKASIMAQTVEGEQTETIPATFLQQHDNCTFCIDRSAASQLTRQCHPWLVGRIEWTEETTRKAVLWLAQKTGKSLLKLVDEDYTENGMSDLLVEQGPAYDLNIRLFNVTQHTITGWPGGKPNADDSHRPERATPYPKRSLILSPEPLDDVYCLGGTINRLKQHGNQVTIAYQTSGNLAVPDTEVRSAIELMIELGTDRIGEADLSYATTVETQLNEKGSFGADTSEIRQLKGLIRRSEARSSARTLSIDTDNLHFMDLPFYEQGRYRRFVASEADVNKMCELLNKVQPHQIFATGFGHDPLSVPALCFEILRAALKQCADTEWFKDCNVWLYKGPADEWEAHEIDMAVPLSPDEFENKIQGIYQHQTQRSQSPGRSSKKSSNTWDLAREINCGTAEVYDALGLAEYEAIECFKRYTH